MANPLIHLLVTPFYNVIILRASTWSNVTTSFFWIGSESWYNTNMQFLVVMWTLFCVVAVNKTVRTQTYLSSKNGLGGCSTTKNSAANQKPGLQSRDFGRNNEEAGGRGESQSFSLKKWITLKCILNTLDTIWTPYPLLPPRTPYQLRT